MEWQPIETAPKDGWFMAHVKLSMGINVPGGVVTACHYSDNFGGEYQVYRLVNHRHHGGFYIAQCFDGWMPLPEPPK